MATFDTILAVMTVSFVASIMHHKRSSFNYGVGVPVSPTLY